MSRQKGHPLTRLEKGHTNNLDLRSFAEKLNSQVSVARSVAASQDDDLMEDALRQHLH